MESKRKIKAREFAHDVRAGLTDFELMSKYGLSFDELEALFDKLVKAGILRRPELRERAAFFEDDTNKRTTRGLSRGDVRFLLPVVDVNDASNTGIVRDISMRGFRTAGLSANPEEIRTVRIKADVFSGLQPFVVEAECRWVKEKGKDKTYITAGFEITRISETHLRKLQELLKTVGLGP
jgi:hypothetical protein